MDQQTYGLSSLYTSLSENLNSNFRGLDNAVCTLGYQNQAGVNALSAQLAQCCCDTRSAIKDVDVGIERTGWNLSRQLSDCCCDIEKMNMQNRFDAQAYNCNTLQAIDASTDRILKYLQDEKTQALRDENFALRLSASQAQQNQYLVNQLKEPCAIPAYVVPNPNCCYGNPVGIGYNNGGCGCGNGNF